MNFSKYRFKSNYLNVFVLGLITSFIIFLPFLIKDHGLFLFYGDYDVQQIPFYRTAHDAIRSGSMGWNWNTDLGVNFVGSYSFYLLGSPFFWLTLVFPNTVVPYLMAPLLMLKFGLTCVTGYAFINRFTKYSSTAIIGALLYAFSGFNIYNIFFNHFNEVVLIFPLLLIALEELVINNRRGAFAIVVALSATVNYYFFFGQVIFVVIYFIFRCTSKDFNMTVRKFLAIVIEAVIGLLLSGFMLMPAILAITGNSRLGDNLTGFDMILYGDVQRYGLIISSFFFPPDIPARPNFFPNSNAKWSSVSMFLPVISVTGVLAFFKGEKKHWAKKLIFASVIIALIPVLNSAFSAFNYSYYARWFYMPLLIMVMVSCIALEKHTRHFKFSIILTAICVGAFALIGILPKKINGALSFFKLVEYPDRFWAYVAIAMIGLLITAMLTTLTIRYKHFFRYTIAGVMLISILFSTYMIYLGKLSGEGYDTVKLKAIDGREKLTLEDDGFYRIDTFDELDNLGMHWKMPTINAFHSIVPPSVMEYYDAIGQERGVASRPKPQAVGIRGLTSVKYSFTSEEKDEKNAILGFNYWKTQNGYRIYKNEHFIPMGFTYDYFLTKEQFQQHAETNKDRVLLSGLMLEPDDYERYKAMMPVLEDTKTYDEQLLNDDYFKSCKDRAKNSAYYFDYNGKGFTSKINCENQELVFFSVPFDEGFTATVNGQQAEILKANIGFMAVAVPKGESEIVFTYKTPGAVNGLLVSLLALLALTAYLFLIKLKRKRSPEQYRYQKNRHLATIDCDDTLITQASYVDMLKHQKEKDDE